MTPLSGSAPLSANAGTEVEPGGPVLTMESVTIVFGGLTAVKGVSFEVQKGSLTGLIGPNGAGKTTIFNLMTGVYRPTAGRITFKGIQIAGPARTRGSRVASANTADETAGVTVERPDTAGRSEKKPERMTSLSRRDVARAGICRTFQNIRLFQALTVLDNVLVATNLRHSESLTGAMLRTNSFYETERRAREEALSLLETMKLDSYASMAARNLPYGAQRRLEIARALATEPQLLLLDEPAAGMNPQESADLVEMIRWVRSHFNLTILLIEHDMKVVMGLCEQILVLDNGALIASGSPGEIRANPRVIAAYLGEAQE